VSRYSVTVKLLMFTYLSIYDFFKINRKCRIKLPCTNYLYKTLTFGCQNFGNYRYEIILVALVLAFLLAELLVIQYYLLNICSLLFSRICRGREIKGMRKWQVLQYTA